MLLLNAALGCIACGIAIQSSQAGPQPRFAYEPPVPARDWQAIVVHHSATNSGNVASIDAEHRRRLDSQGRPWLGIGYHFVIGNGQSMPDGEVQPTFRWREQLTGAHSSAPRMNETGIAICLIGNFERQPPTPKQLATLERLLAELTRRFSVSHDRILRHQDVQATLCPGQMFPWQQILADLRVETKGI